jgi:hypothetical protein
LLGKPRSRNANLAGASSSQPPSHAPISARIGFVLTQHGGVDDD